jgi:hypothetical protein
VFVERNQRWAAECSPALVKSITTPPQLVLKQKKQGFYVHSEDAVKSFLGLICEQPVFPGDPGIVKCVVEPSEGFESEWYDPLHLLGLAEVCLDERRRSTVAFDLIDEQSPLALPPSCDNYLSS